jgi:hypothetical protein
MTGAEALSICQLAWEQNRPDLQDDLVRTCDVLMGLAVSTPLVVNASSSFARRPRILLEQC